MVDGPEHLEAHAGADLAGEGALSFTTLPLGEVGVTSQFAQNCTLSQEPW